jgi:transketolase
MCSISDASHVGSALSVVDILAVLYSEVAKFDPRQPDHPERDYIIVSKGHAAAGLYAVLAHAGFFPVSLLDTYCSNGGYLGGHVTAGAVAGVEFSTGSLGHGLPFGVGLAMARKRRKLPGRTFVIISDGECDEGTTWESALLAAHHQLGSLVVVVDRNRLQSLASTEATLRLEPLADKWTAFGWRVVSCDGHDHEALALAMGLKLEPEQPTIVICETIKGRGVPFMEDQVVWHYRSPSAKDLADAYVALGTGL